MPSEKSLVTIDSRPVCVGGAAAARLSEIFAQGLDGQAPRSIVPFTYPILFLGEPIARLNAEGHPGNRVLPVQESQVIETQGMLAAGDVLTFRGTVEHGPDALSISAEADAPSQAKSVRMRTRVRLIAQETLGHTRPNSRLPRDQAWAHEIRTAPLDADLVRAYSAVSGDFNPVHLDPEAARAYGLPGPIVHGMLLAGLVEGAAATALGLQIRELRIWFLTPMPVGKRAVIRFAPAQENGNRSRLSIASGERILAVGDVDLGAL